MKHTPKIKIDYANSGEDDERFHKFGIHAKSTKEEQKRALTWALLASYLPGDVKSIEKDFVRHAEYTLALTRNNITNFTAFKSTSLSVRDRLIERWKDTQDYFFEKDCKRVAYLSLEFLLGRSLQNAIYNLTLEENYHKAMLNLGFALEDLFEEENDAGLGNGGLGRLAACFLDSLATCDYPGWGYGLRYTYGMFHQEIINGKQTEFPDYWLVKGNPWEVERLDVAYVVNFYGKTIELDGKEQWVDTEDVKAVAYDTPIPGYKTFNTLNIRLWSAKPVNEFDLKHFNSGDFYKSIEERQKAEQITQVLYPNDNSYSGKELRLKQQYFFVSATLQDLIRRFKRKEKNFDNFPEKVAVQLNDTHPTLAIVELMRYLLDFECYEWKRAWDIVTRTFAYTNHTVLPEALERWPVPLLENLLPRHMRIIYDINFHWLSTVGNKWPNDIKKLQTLSIIEEGYPKYVRMSHLAIVGSHHVNGVARIHTEILRNTIFSDFVEIFPTKFSNKTNGVTPRRWVQQANPPLAKLISEKLGGVSWLVDWKRLKGLAKFAEDEKFQHLWQQARLMAKEKLAKQIREKCEVDIPTHFLFDVQVKRIHEYKRQLMNILFVIHKYNTFKKLSATERKKLVPRAIIFGGKAAPGYEMAKLIIYLINCVANVINKDEEAKDYLKVVFLPNYCVSFAEIIIPGCDISQHISTAGMEASGTSNMKFAMNGVLILGTMDGANVEIAEEIGQENMFIFGATADKVPELRHQTRMGKIKADPNFAAVLHSLKNGDFGDPQQWRPIFNALEHGNDYYLLEADFSSYVEAQERVDRCYQNPKEWTKKSILSSAGSGKFSSDRTIYEYAHEIWGIHQVRRPGAKPVQLEKLHSDDLIPGTSDLGISPSFEKESLLIESRTPLMEKLYPSSDGEEKKEKEHVYSGEPKNVIEGFNVSKN